MAAILVLDGEQRAALAVVRSLGSTGHDVFVCSTLRHSLGGASRYCTKSFLTPDPLHQPNDFTAAVRSLIRELDIAVVLPVTEASLHALLPHRSELNAVLPCGTHASFLATCDKAKVAEEAARLGIGVPRQQRLACPSDVYSLPPMMYPLVAKPQRSVVADDKGRGKFAVKQVSDEAALREYVAQLPSVAFPLLLQERIIGPGVGIFMLLRDQKVLAAFSHRRIREKPPSGGVSVMRESWPLDADLLRRSVDLVKALGWEGVAMVEYKLDAATGIPYIMEINPRFWGSLQLAVDAGVDFPAILLRAFSGPDVPGTSTDSYRVGVRSRWTWGEVDHLIARLRKSKRELSLPDNEYGRLRAVREFVLSFGPASRDEVFRLSDPAPGLLESLQWWRRK